MLNPSKFKEKWSFFINMPPRTLNYGIINNPYAKLDFFIAKTTTRYRYNFHTSFPVKVKQRNVKFTFVGSQRLKKYFLYI
ncbi:MAG: hypothetical protein CFE23_12290 [Flavobacterium sp. BFFFF1]|nr:MAG: hypothetical protein CFE23_12290 [Flavobacterium sp. BFFFF1]